MKTTTIEIYTVDLPTFKQWATPYGLKMPDFLRSLKSAVREHKQREMYSKLPMPSDYKKPLAGKKIDKCRLNRKFVELVGNRIVMRKI